eukprot:gene5964-32431_t
MVSALWYRLLPGAQIGIRSSGAGWTPHLVGPKGFTWTEACLPVPASHATAPTPLLPRQSAVSFRPTPLHTKADSTVSSPVPAGNEATQASTSGAEATGNNQREKNPGMKTV